MELETPNIFITCERIVVSQSGTGCLPDPKLGSWSAVLAAASSFSLLIRSFFLAARTGVGKTKAWIEEKIEWAKSSGLLEGYHPLYRRRI